MPGEVPNPQLQEGLRQFHGMVKVGIERFNEGSLPEAVSMLEMAERLQAEEKVDTESVEMVRCRLGDTLDRKRLKKFAENPDEHALLRNFLRFFTALRPEGLLDELQREPNRDRRRLMLLLLEVHGTLARVAAYERLGHALAPDVEKHEWFFRRNLLYLLHRIPRSPGTRLEDEIDLVVRHAQFGLPVFVVKEAIGALGQLKDEKAENVLIRLLEELESMSSRPQQTLYAARDLRALVDRVMAALARLGTPRARHAVVGHAEKRNAELGGTMGWLVELGNQNLSGDEVTIDRLVVLIKANLPSRLVGLVFHKNDQNIVHMIEALSGTPLPVVRRTLEEIVDLFSGQESGRAAARVLARFDKPRSTRAASSPPADSDPWGV
jgi:hypothetical protein